jgi:hypothetical protein
MELSEFSYKHTFEQNFLYTIEFAVTKWFLAFLGLFQIFKTKARHDKTNHDFLIFVFII